MAWTYWLRQWNRTWRNVSKPAQLTRACPVLHEGSNIDNADHKSHHHAMLQVMMMIRIGHPILPGCGDHSIRSPRADHFLPLQLFLLRAGRSQIRTSRPLKKRAAINGNGALQVAGQCL